MFVIANERRVADHGVKPWKWRAKLRRCGLLKEVAHVQLCGFASNSEQGSSLRERLAVQIDTVKAHPGDHGIDPTLGQMLGGRE
jgi:hypothetical protein